jgi:hypothetical protein
MPPILPTLAPRSTDTEIGALHRGPPEGLLAAGEDPVCAPVATPRSLGAASDRSSAI